MTDLFRLIAVFAVILFLLKRKLNIGFVMLIAAALLFLLYRMPPALILDTAGGAVLNSVTIKLILALSFIRVFEMILREHAVLSGMMDGVKAIFRNRKIVTISMPLLIGLIPSVGGAYFSAPMVAETTRDLKITPEEKGFINYWFRHPWEYILPLYPGILLASAVSKIELHTLITVNLSYAVLLVLTGFMFSMRGLKGVVRTDHFSEKGLWNFVPIFAVLFLVLVFHVELHYALIAMVLILFLFYKYKVRAIIATLRHGFSLEVIILIVGVMFFKEAMENSGAVNNLSRFFMREGIPISPVLFLLPFLTGILTGLTVGFVGSTFPLIISLAGNSSIGAISFAFASGFLGVLLSPTHICLILTKEYFKADLWGIYKMMIPGSVIIFLGAIVEYLILK
jgi:integral membrane protein (TIGR00529 family)